MPSIIAKKLNVTLDTIKQTIVRTDFIAIIGDSIEITINLTENNQPKNITESKARLVGIRSDKTTFEQTEKVEIVDGINGIIKIYPRLDIFSIEGQTICSLIIEDLDESINIQRFVVTVAKSMVSDVLIETKDEIETLKRLNNLLNTYQESLTSIEKSTVDMENLVVQKTNKVNTDFENLSNGIQVQVDELQNNINGVSNIVNYELTKSIKLKPYRLSGSSFIYFQTEPFNILSDELLYRSYMVFLSGVVDTGSHNTAVGILTFYRLNGKIYCNFLSLSDRVVSNKNLSPSVVFGDLTSEISSNVTGFRLMVKSNILKSLNTDDGVKCVLTPIGLQGGILNNVI